MRDSSVPAIERTISADGDGAFSFDVAGLNAPFALKAVDASGAKLYAVAQQAGEVNLDALSTAAFAATSSDDSDDEDGGWSNFDASSARVAESVLGNLRTVLKPLLDHYGVRYGENMADSRAFKTMLTEVSFVMNNRILTIANRATGGVIFTAPQRDLASGVLHPENIPGGVVTPGACTYTYSAWGTCPASGTQARTVVSATPAGCAGTPVLTQACVVIPPVGTCTAFTYTAFAPAVCPANGQQTRTVTTSSPAGCTGGSPVLTQTCTPPPPVLDGAALYASKCASCHGALATSSKKGRTAAQITSANMTQGLSAAQVQAVATALAVAPPAACTSFTYSAFAPAVCPVSGTQTRTVLTRSPTGCTGGSPAALTQTCTYVPPVNTCSSFTYSAFAPAVCPASGQQTRTVLTRSPTGCTGGSPAALTQACTPPALNGAALYASSCSSCHGALASSAKAGRTAAQITAANMTQGLTAAQVQAVAAALATVAPPVTGAALYTQYCSGCHGNGMTGSSVSSINGAINGGVSQMGTATLRALTAAQIAAISAT